MDFFLVLSPTDSLLFVSPLSFFLSFFFFYFFPDWLTPYCFWQTKWNEKNLELKNLKFFKIISKGEEESRVTQKFFQVKNSFLRQKTLAFQRYEMLKSILMHKAINWCQFWFQVKALRVSLTAVEILKKLGQCWLLRH